jgi:hypothetical protein
MFLLSRTFIPAVGPHGSYSNGYRSALQGIKRPMRDSDPSTASAADVKMGGAKPLFILYAFLAWTDNCTFLLCFSTLL